MITCSSNGASGQCVMMTIHRTTRHQARDVIENKQRSANLKGLIGPTVSAEPYGEEANDTNMKTARLKNAKVS